MQNDNIGTILFKKGLWELQMIVGVVPSKEEGPSETGRLGRYEPNMCLNNDLRKKSSLQMICLKKREAIMLVTIHAV